MSKKITNKVLKKLNILIFLKAEKKLLDKEGISGLKDEEFYYLTKEKYLN